MTDRTCSIDGCERSAASKDRGKLGMCGMHYQRSRKGMSMEAAPRRRPRGPERRCRIEGCGRTDVVAKELCDLHYGRLKRGREVGQAAPLIRPRGAGGLNAQGYVVFERVVDGQRVAFMEHRLVMEQHLARPLLPSENVHHRNGDRADNRIANLELWSCSQPPGQRAIDKLAWAREIIALYGSDADAGLI